MNQASLASASIILILAFPSYLRTSQRSLTFQSISLSPSQMVQRVVFRKLLPDLFLCKGITCKLLEIASLKILIRLSSNEVSVIKVQLSWNALEFHFTFSISKIFIDSWAKTGSLALQVLLQLSASADFQSLLEHYHILLELSSLLIHLLHFYSQGLRLVCVSRIA